jgi:Arc/MetJ family transcription regulator
MRINIIIDEDLMNEAIRLTGANTKRETVELALKTLIDLKKQEVLKNFRGKLTWEGDLNDMRTNK